MIDAESALKRGDYPETMRYSQEAVEMSLKAVLRVMAIEYPKVHDVGDIVYVNICIQIGLECRWLILEGSRGSWP